jgi:hypothetical protein
MRQRGLAHQARLRCPRRLKNLPVAGVLAYNQDAARQRLCDWIDGHDRSACAFDFPTKGILQVRCTCGSPACFPCGMSLSVRCLGCLVDMHMKAV